MRQPVALDWPSAFVLITLTFFRHLLSFIAKKKKNGSMVSLSMSIQFSLACLVYCKNAKTNAICVQIKGKKECKTKINFFVLLAFNV